MPACVSQIGPKSDILLWGDVHISPRQFMCGIPTSHSRFFHQDGILAGATSIESKQFYHDLKTAGLVV